MLRNTFCHVPGIGGRTENRLWSSGIRCWDDMLGETKFKPTWSKTKMRVLEEHIQESALRLHNEDAGYFSGLLSPDQLWRLFPEFRKSCAYLDIETTGMGGPGDHITTIALYDGRSVSYYVYGRNLDNFKEDIRKFSLIVTYNGRCFDVPFIRNHLGIQMDQAHIDLRYVLRSLGYSGGLKGCEKQLGICREALDGVDGLFAVFLWQEYKRRKDERALETLLAYNILDAVNLEKLMVMAYNLKLGKTPFSRTHVLPIPIQPSNPFEPDRMLIERIKDELQRFQFPM